MSTTVDANIARQLISATMCYKNVALQTDEFSKVLATMKLLANYKKVSILIMIDAFAMAMATQLTLFQRSFQMIKSIDIFNGNLG